MIKYCKRCLYPSNHPLNLIIDEDGICSGCRVHEEKNIINWEKKRSQFSNIVKEYKSNSGKNYDCIVPVSGASDSYYILHLVKNIYKMNPLVVTYNKQYNTKLGIRNLANLKDKFDVDVLTLTVDPYIVKKITRHTLRVFGSIYWHCIAGQTVFPVQVATRMKVPLIIWGCHQGLDQTGMFSHHDQVEMTRKYRKEHDLLGFEAEDLIEDIDGLTIQDVSQYIYPDNQEITNVGVRGIYLNNFFKWDSKTQHQLMVEKYDYGSYRQNRTYDTYNNSDCWNYNDLHDYIKFIKFGYSKVVDQVCRDIRLCHISRSKAIDIVNNYIFKKPKNSNLFFNWLGITKNAFNYVMDQHRNKDIWIRDENWNWTLKKDFLVNSYFKYPEEKVEEPILVEGFENNNNKFSSDDDDSYILIGKGC